MVEYCPISARDQSRLHQCGKKVLPGKIFDFAFEELEKIDASEIHARRPNAKEALTPQTGREFFFPNADGTAKLLGRDHELRESALRQEYVQGVNISVQNFKANRKVFNRQNGETTQKPRKTVDLFKVTSFIVITMNLEFNSVCRKK